MNGDNNQKLILIDPPSGWRYGFPKAVTQEQYKEITSLKEWCIENGYLKKEADSFGNSFHIGVSGELPKVVEIKEPITYTEEEVLEHLNNLNDLLEEKQYISNINEGVISTSNMSIKEINELNKREEHIQSITNDNFEIDVRKWFEQNKKK